MVFEEIKGQKTNHTLETEKFISQSDRITVENETVLNNTFSDHSNEIDEIISNKPPFIVRWGTVFFFFLLLLIGLISWFIPYPDIVTTKAKLTSVNAPKTIVCKTDGKLVKLKIKDNDIIQAGGIIGFIESTSDHEQVLALSANIDTLAVRFSKNNNLVSANFFNPSYKNLGELQQVYQIFSQALIDFKNYLHGGFYEKKKQMLQNDLSDVKRLKLHLSKQKVSQQQDVALAEKTFEMNEILRKEKVISELEYRNEKSKLLMKQLAIPQINEAMVANETQQNEKLKEIMDLQNTVAQQASIFQQALQTFKSDIDAWKKKFLLVAPVSGKVSFMGFLQENQQLQNNQTVCFINPDNSGFFAEIFIPQENFGKVEKGQKVLLKFSSYPSQEFGSVTGRLGFISAIPTDSGYLAKILLPNGLTTNYHKEVQYREGLTAKAEIITKNLRLLERLYYNLRKEIQR